MENFTSDLENLKVMKPLFQDKWFHTYKEDGDITYQGHVLDYAPPQFILVQLFFVDRWSPNTSKTIQSSRS